MLFGQLNNAIKWLLWLLPNGGGTMKTMSAKDAKNAFGLLLDNARAEPVTVEKHGRAVVVVLSVEEYERLNCLNAASADKARAA